ncbi:MAG: lipopolysaccharide biosynthesis protein [Pseudomonadota bacterium]
MTTPVGRSVLVYGCAFAVAGATPFVLLPFLTQRLAPAEFGVVASFLMFVALLANLTGLSVHGFASVRYFKEERATLAAMVADATALLLISHALAALGVLLLLPLLQRTLGLPLEQLLLGVAAALVLNVNVLWLALFQSSQQPLRYLKARLLQAGLEIGLCVALVLAVAAVAVARTGSYAVAIAARAVLGAWWCRRQGLVAGWPGRGHWRALLRFGLPLLPHLVAGTAIVHLDRLVVSTQLGPQSLGLYMSALQLGMVMVLLVEPLHKALAPWLFAQLAKNDDAVRRMVVKRTYALFAGLAALGAVFALAAVAAFDRLVGPAYLEARALVPWMVAGFVLQGLYYGVVNYLFYAERTGRLSMATGTAAVVGAAVAWTLTSAFGLTGAAMSFVVNNAMLLTLVWAMAARAVPMPWWPWGGARSSDGA